MLVIGIPSLSEQFKVVDVSNKMESFSYNIGCGIYVNIEVFIIPYSWFFSRYLNSVNGRFSVLRDFIFTNGSAKSSALQWVVRFFEGLNFTNDQHPRNSWNLRTSKKPNYTVYRYRRAGLGYT